MKHLIHFRKGLGLLIALLVMGAAVTPALADGTAVITVYARGAALGQRVEVQWGDAIGGWHRVDGWTGTLDNMNGQGEPFKSYTVDSANFGQKPFRWVIYYPDGSTIWAVGPPFTLPTVAGTNYGQPLDVQYPMPSMLGTAQPAVAGSVTPPGTEPLLGAHTFTFGGCGNCPDSTISALIGGLPSSIWIAVQWQDGLGQWHTVDGWQGFASSTDPNGVLFQQWDVGPALFGRGPFRWALYDYFGGNLIGVSPSFNMPATSRLNLIMSMRPWR